MINSGRSRRARRNGRGVGRRRALRAPRVRADADGLRRQLCDGWERRSSEIGGAAAGDWYIGLYGTGAYSGVALTASSTNAAALRDGTPLSSLSAGSGTWRYDKITLPAGVDALNVITAGGTSTWRCTSGVAVCRLGSSRTRTRSPRGTASRSALQPLRPGDWYIGLYGTRSLLRSHADGRDRSGTVVGNGAPAEQCLGRDRELGLRQAHAGSAAELLRATTVGGTGEVDVFARRGALPTEGVWMRARRPSATTIS